MKLEGVALWMTVVGGLSMFGCGDSAEGAGGGDTGSPSSGSGGEVCYSVPVNETNDGSAACGPSVCKGGEYCFSDVGICDPGCLSELNCPAKQYCDLSGAGADGVGLCRVPGKAQQKPCSSSHGSGAGSDCSTRCKAKAAVCGAPQATADQACSMLCPDLSEDQISCLETSSCEVLQQLTDGKSVCGIMGSSD